MIIDVWIMKFLFIKCLSYNSTTHDNRILRIIHIIPTIDMPIEKKMASGSGKNANMNAQNIAINDKKYDRIKSIFI